MSGRRWADIRGDHTRETAVPCQSLARCRGWSYRRDGLCGPCAARLDAVPARAREIARRGTTTTTKNDD